MTKINVITLYTSYIYIYKENVEKEGGGKQKEGADEGIDSFFLSLYCKKILEVKVDEDWKSFIISQALFI